MGMVSYHTCGRIIPHNYPSNCDLNQDIMPKSGKYIEEREATMKDKLNEKNMVRKTNVFISRRKTLGTNF